MDNEYFNDLLGLAKQTQAENLKKNAGSKFLNTKVEAAKKEPKDRSLSQNIRKFLDRKDEEVKAKDRHERQKTRTLLEMRQGNKVSSKAARRMLAMTKSANKLGDVATPCQETSREQCDDDDYGYESGMARALYDKLMTKYEANPTPDPFARKPPKREEKPRPKPPEGGEKKPPCGRKPPPPEAETTKMPPPRPKPKHQPPKKQKRSFGELMAMAQRNAHSGGGGGGVGTSVEPTGGRGSSGPQVKESEFDRPMTEKEKAERRREIESEARKSGRGPPKSKLERQQPPAKSKAADQRAAKSKVAAAAEPQPTKGKKPNGSKADEKRAAGGRSVTGEKQKGSKAPEAEDRPVPPKEGGSGCLGKLTPAQVEKMRQMNRKAPPAPSKEDAGKKKKKKKPRSVEEVESRPFPGERKPAAPAKKRFDPSKVKRMRIESDDDDEEDADSEMDDFIDDSGANVDIGAEIRSIFGYDRRRFREEDDFDDRDMENNRYSDVMKEEARSAKIGRMEDLEDMRQEEEEKSRKMMLKKKKRRR